MTSSKLSPAAHWRPLMTENTIKFGMGNGTEATEVIRLTSVTELSPAARAVAWAYDNAPETPTGNHRYHWLAAALRAVADQLGESRAPGVEFEHLYGRIVEVDDLLAIAVELEAQ